MSFHEETLLRARCAGRNTGPQTCLPASPHTTTCRLKLHASQPLHHGLQVMADGDDIDAVLMLVTPTDGRLLRTASTDAYGTAIVGSRADEHDALQATRTTLMRC